MFFFLFVSKLQSLGEFGTAQLAISNSTLFYSPFCSDKVALRTFNHNFIATKAEREKEQHHKRITENVQFSFVASPTIFHLQWQKQHKQLKKYFFSLNYKCTSFCYFLGRIRKGRERKRDDEKNKTKCKLLKDASLRSFKG